MISRNTRKLSESIERRSRKRGIPGIHGKENKNFAIRFTVRFRDVDALGHVNNAVYFTYMESARTEYWRSLFGLQTLNDLRFIVAHAECDFKIAAKFGDEIEVTVCTSEIRNSSFVWDYKIKNPNDGTIYAVGKTIQVYYDYDQQKGMPVPSEVRSKLLG